MVGADETTDWAMAATLVQKLVLYGNKSIPDRSWADVINKIESIIAMLCWNKALWLVEKVTWPWTNNHLITYDIGSLETILMTYFLN